MVAAITTFTHDNTKDSRKIHIFLDTFVEAVTVDRRVLYKWEGSYW